MTPYYSDSLVTIYHGDCRELLPSIGAADLVLTDPPYNAINRATQGLRRLDKGAADSLPVDVATMAPMLLGAAPSVYVWCSGEQFTQWVDAFKARGATTRNCAWWKTNPSPMNGEHLWLSAMELCVFARRAGAVFNGHCEHPVWRGATDSEDLGNETPKPRWLMERLIRASSQPNGIVLDPYCGSGTTLRAAKDLGRRAIGIDIREAQCEIAALRCRQEVLDLGGVA